MKNTCLSLAVFSFLVACNFNCHLFIELIKLAIVVSGGDALIMSLYRVFSALKTRKMLKSRRFLDVCCYMYNLMDWERLIYIEVTR